MSQVAFFGGLALVVAAIVLFLISLARPVKTAPGEPPRQKPFSRKMAGLSVLSLVLAAALLYWGAAPGVTDQRLAEAQTITHDTFRDQLGKVPDSISFDRTNTRTLFEDGWSYKGTARCGTETWDVTVSRNNDRSSHQTILKCEAVPRK